MTNPTNKDENKIKCQKTRLRDNLVQNIPGSTVPGWEEVPEPYHPAVAVYVVREIPREKRMTDRQMISKTYFYLV